MRPSIFRSARSLLWLYTRLATTELSTDPYIKAIADSRSAPSIIRFELYLRAVPPYKVRFQSVEIPGKHQTPRIQLKSMS